MIRRVICFNFILAVTLVFLSCDDSTNEPAFIPNAIVDFEVNINLPQYFDLSRQGGHAFISNEGDRGIILYRNENLDIIAFESNCSYMPDNDCANVMVDQTGLFMVDTCCQSTFDFEGIPTRGPASAPLFKYFTSLNGDFLKISN